MPAYAEAAIRIEFGLPPPELGDECGISFSAIPVPSTPPTARPVKCSGEEGEDALTVAFEKQADAAFTVDDDAAPGS